MNRDYNGPARVGGGPGTGKTIVALHRVKHLAERLPAGRDKPILLTTFNENLAADLRSRLLALGGETLLARVEISHVDQLALRIVREAEPGSRKQTVDHTHPRTRGSPSPGVVPAVYCSLHGFDGHNSLRSRTGPVALTHRVPADMFRFTTGNLAPLYSAILQAFGDANERLVTALGLDEVRERLRGVGWFDALTDDDLTGALTKLRAWELLDVTQNHAENYRTAEEYERRNLQYSLTRRGEAAFAGVQHALSVLASTGALQTAVLDAIADRLDELDRLMREREGGSGDRRVFSTLQELEGHLDALRANTKQFNGELQRLLRADGAELSTFKEVKGATVAYLQEFLTNLDQRAHAVAAAVGRIEERDPEVVWQRALRGAELPPVGGGDPGPEWLARRRARWEGLRAWFLPADGSTARVEQLHHVARRAIVTLLQVLDRITESRRRSTGAVQDFRELARWFAAAPGEDDLHRLWATAFGLGPSRHAHLAHADPELVAATASWRDAPPVEVSALLRTSGRTEQFSRTGRVRDVSALKAARAERARLERAELEAAWSLLRTEGPVRLSHFGRLDHEVFERLMDLLGRALAVRPDAVGVRRAVTGDGQVEVVLRAAEAGAAPAVLRTLHGTLSCPDYVIEVHAAGVAGAGSGGGGR